MAADPYEGQPGCPDQPKMGELLWRAGATISEGGVIGQVGNQKRNISFFKDSCSISQLLAPWNGIPSFGPRPPGPWAEHSSSLWNSLASSQYAHLECAAGFRTFQWTLALSSVLGLLALTQFEGGYSPYFLNGASCSSTPAVQGREGASVPLRQREQGHG